MAGLGVFFASAGSTDVSVKRERVVMEINARRDDAASFLTVNNLFPGAVGLGRWKEVSDQGVARVRRQSRSKADLYIVRETI